MARLGLRFDLLSRGARDAERDLDRLGDAADRSGSRVSRLGGALKVGLGGAALGGLAAFTAGLKGGLEEAISYEKITDQLAQTLKSTGNAAGTSIGELKAYAGELESLSGVDEELILSSQNVLATFTKIGNKVGEGNDIFDQASLAALNLSTTLGTSVVGAATQVGKALNDPLKGISALGKAGVSFTVEQKALIKSLVESGDTLGAQKVILKELEVQYGGAAKAAGEGLGGSLARLQDSVSDSFRTIATAALPTLANLSEALAAKLPGAIATVSGAFGAVSSAVKGTVGFLNDNREAVLGLAVAYTATLLPGMVRAAAFAAGGLIASFAAAAASAKALALRLGAAALASAPLVALGAVVGGVGLAISKGRQEAEKLDGALRALGETKIADPGFDAARAKAAEAVKVLEEFGKAPERLRVAREELARLDGAVVTSNANVGRLAQAFGLTNTELLELASAAKVDLGTATYDEAKLKIDAFRAAQSLAGTAAGNLAAAQQTLGSAVADAGQKVRALSDAFNAFFGVALSASAANDRYEASLDAVTASLKTNGRTLDAGTEKGRANRDVIRSIITASEEKARADLEAGGSQARYNQTLAAGRQRAREAAVALARNSGEVRNLTRDLRLVPGPKKTGANVQITPGDAAARIRAIREAIAGIKSKVVTVTTRIKNLFGGGGGPASARAGGPTADFRAAPSDTPRSNDNPRFRQAGEVAGASFRTGLSRAVESAPEAIRRVSAAARTVAVAETKKTLATMEATLQAAKDKLSRTRDKLLEITNLRRQLVSSVADSLRGSVDSLFGATSIDQVIATLDAQRNTLRKFLSDITQLRSRGVSNNLLNDLLTAGPDQAGSLVSVLSSASEDELSKVLALQTNISGLAGRGATAAGNATLGRQIAVAQLAYETQRQSLAQLQNLGRLTKETNRLLGGVEAAYRGVPLDARTRARTRMAGLPQ